MTKLAAIDISSGFVWGISSHTDLIEAAKDVTEQCDGGAGISDEYNFEITPTAGHSGYAFYRVADNFDVSDGQSQREIEATTAHPIVGYVSMRHAYN